MIMHPARDAAMGYALDGERNHTLFPPFIRRGRNGEGAGLACAVHVHSDMQMLAGFKAIPACRRTQYPGAGVMGFVADLHDPGAAFRQRPHGVDGLDQVFEIVPGTGGVEQTQVEPGFGFHREISCLVCVYSCTLCAKQVSMFRIVNVIQKIIKS